MSCLMNIVGVNFWCSRFGTSVSGLEPRPGLTFKWCLVGQQHAKSKTNWRKRANKLKERRKHMIYNKWLPAFNLSLAQSAKTNSMKKSQRNQINFIEFELWLSSIKYLVNHMRAEYLCYKSVLSFRVICLFTGQCNTKYYGTITDVI